MTPTEQERAGASQLRERIAHIIEEQAVRAAQGFPAEPLEAADRILELLRASAADSTHEAHLDPADYEPQERADTIAGVRRGIEAMRQGRIRPWNAIVGETRDRYGLSEESGGQ